MRAWGMDMFFDLTKTLRSLTAAPATTAIDQARRMARARLQAGGAAVPVRKQGDQRVADDYLLPDGVDAAAVARGVRQKLGISEPVGDGADALHPLEQRKLGGRIRLSGLHLLRLGDGRFDKGRAFMHRLVADMRVRRMRHK